MDGYSYLSNGDVGALEALYQQYKTDPNSVDFGWQKFFEGFDFRAEDYSSSDGVTENMHQEFKVLNLIDGYRSRGHLFTRTNPVRERRKYAPTLAIENFGLEQKDLAAVYQAGKEVGLGPATLKDIIAHLEETYCQSIGIEYTYMRDPDRVEWLRNKFELKNRVAFSKAQKLHTLKKLNQTTLFEQYLQKKFVGQKRFSIEGGEALIPAIDAIIEHGSTLGLKEVVVGMAHRGRLNMLAHIFGKPHEEIFAEFAGTSYEDEDFDGDVKYHLGYSKDVVADSGEQLHLTLSPNPSHLEAVGPVVQGISRAKLDKHLHKEEAILPIVIHGDAALAGQGVVYEMVQMANLDGYRAGGTIHLVVNNQVGFTTNYLDARSSTYCTDVGKTTLCPVFHVNGDDIEAVVQTVLIATEYRQTFKRDVFIDLLGFRKYGHNEGDEPKFTQPKLYKAIAKHPDLRAIYIEQLISEGIITAEESNQLKKKFEGELDKAFDASKKIENSEVMHFMAKPWEKFRVSTDKDFDKSPKTAVDKKKLIALAKAMSTLPPGKNYFRKVEKLMNDRIKMVEKNELDWGMGEMLAYATLLDEQSSVRMSGQDVERGTFSHRHAVVKTEDTEEEIIPLNRLSSHQAKLSIYNSLLSEYAVMGFEYGYAFANPDGLTIWEAQFGDFNNGAQIIIDQFISAAEDKWRTMNGLVLLLPHGYEGMGSEHSSARMERYLLLCADNNMAVTNVTTPANYFHLLRRQLHWEFRKPLIVFSPKKLLRYPKAVSAIEEMATGQFEEVLDDPLFAKSGAKVDTVVLCCGKFYYDLLQQKEEKKVGSKTALVRMEQLFPFPEKQLAAVLKRYPKAKRFVWAQEEPENMGAWTYMLRMNRHSKTLASKEWELCARHASGSPAAGSGIVHERRHQEVMSKVLPK